MQFWFRRLAGSCTVEWIVKFFSPSPIPIRKKLNLMQSWSTNFWKSSVRSSPVPPM